MTDRIDSQLNSSQELSAHQPILLADAYNLPSGYDVQVTPQYANCHSTPHGNDVVPGFSLGGGGSANQKQDQSQEQITNVKTSVDTHVQTNAAAEATGGKATATGGSAKIGDITNTNTTTGGTASANIGDINNSSAGGKGGQGGKGGNGGTAVVNEVAGPSAYVESAVQPQSTIPSSGFAEYSFTAGSKHFEQREATGSDSNNGGINLHFPVAADLFPVGIGASWGSSHINKKGEDRVETLHKAGIDAGASILGAATGDLRLVDEGNTAYARLVRQQEQQRPEAKDR